MPQVQTQTKISPISSSDSEISFVPIEHIGPLWKQVEGHLKKPLEIDGYAYTAQDVLNSLINGKMQLWISWSRKKKKVEAAIVTEIVDYPQKRACRYFLAGGDNMKSWFKKMKNEIEQWAKLNKCHRIELVGRKGWSRWLKDYTPKHIVLVKENL
jgi:hypothetical protein